MNYRYFEDSNTIQVYSAGLKIKTNQNSYTGETFKSEDEAIKWLNKYLYGEETNFIDLKIITKQNTLRMKNTKKFQLEDDNTKYIDVLKDDYQYVIRDRQIDNNGIIDLSELEDGIYYYDINIDNGNILLNVKDTTFEIKDGQINAL